MVINNKKKIVDDVWVDINNKVKFIMTAYLIIIIVNSTRVESAEVYRFRHVALDIKG